MTTYISMLRGINVGGHRKIRMADLKILYENLGFKEVLTYIQSGNVIFQTETVMDTFLLTQQIEKVIAATYPFSVPVLVRTQAEWDNLLISNPFLAAEALSMENMYVTFLDELPNSLLLDKIKNLDYPSEPFIILGKDIYLYTADYGKTKLSNSFFENKLKVRATTRNWKTIQQLAILGKGWN
ncbi:MAG: hypothetical protein RLZZ628_298 [Bacteroidota bacterium]|jgi:uncharacterized protein (DUF1697 family)